MDRGEQLTAVQYGVGPIGSRIVRAADRHGIEFLGAVDIDPDIVGRDLGDVAQVGRDLGVTVSDDAPSTLAEQPDVVFHSTVSSLEAAAPQLIEIFEAGANVVSTAEELAYPWRKQPELAASIDEHARDHEVSCLGAGINPGFVMDALPVFLSTPMDSVDSVHIERVQNAGDRRGPLQQKVGAGLSVDRFDTEVAEHAGHVGSPESVGMIADAIGWELTEITESMEPVVADGAIQTDHVSVEAGDVAGIRQVARGLGSDRERITLDLQMYVGAEEPHDTVSLEGRPAIDVTVDGGYHGDIATTAVIRNVAPRVIEAPSGLLTILDVQLPRYEAPTSA